MNFSDTKREKNINASFTSSEINFTSDKENLKDFMDFIHTGTFSERFEEGKIIGQIQAEDYKYLEGNLLPEAVINSVRLGENKEKDDTFSVKIEVDFFSQ